MIRSGHVIVCGVGHLGVRTIIELRARDEEVVAIGSSDEAEETLLGLGVRLVIGDARQPRILREADVAGADSIVMTGDDDLANLNTSLAATELNPTIRIVMRLFDQEVGAHIPDLFPDAVALSSSALAAPGFVSAAIDGEAGSRFHLAGRVLSSRGSDDPAVGERSVPIARLNPDRTVDVLPETDGEGPGLIFIDIADPTVVPAIDPAATRGSMRRRGPGPIARFLATLRARLSRPERRLVRFVTILFGLAILSAIFFWVVAGLDPFDAVSYAITLLTGASLPIDLTRAAENGALRVYAILLSLVGAAIVAVVYAFITDALIRSRLLQTLGRRTVPSNIHDHVIVAGLGSIGYRVAHGIAARGVPVVVVEVSEDGRFTSPARAAGIPVMVGDARHREVLDDLRLGTARALVAATSDDLVNLAIALNARAIRPDLRVVVRLFDPEFAMRIQRGFDIRFTRSVSHLAAPAFAAAAVRSEVVATVPLGDRRVVLFARLRVPAGSRLEGRLARSLDAPGSLRLLAVADPGSETARWDIPGDEVLDADEEVVVVATRSGLSNLLLDASMVADAAGSPTDPQADDLMDARRSGLAGVSGLVSDTAQRTVEAVVAGTTGAIGAGTQAVASVTGAASSVVGVAAGAAGSMAGAVKSAVVGSGSDQVGSGSDQVDGATIDETDSDADILDRTPARAEE